MLPQKMEITSQSIYQILKWILSWKMKLPVSSSSSSSTLQKRLASEAFEEDDHNNK